MAGSPPDIPVTNDYPVMAQGGNSRWLAYLVMTQGTYRRETQT